MAEQSHNYGVARRLTCRRYSIGGLAGELGKGYATIYRWITIGRRIPGSRARALLRCDVDEDCVYILREWVIDFFQELRQEMAA